MARLGALYAWMARNVPLFGYAEKIGSFAYRVGISRCVRQTISTPRLGTLSVSGVDDAARRKVA